MKIRTTKFRLNIDSISLILVLFMLSSCTEMVRPTIDLKFTNSINGNPIALHDLAYTNAAGNQYDIMRLKYLISTIKLHESNGNEVLLEDVHFVDSENTSSIYLESPLKIPVGNYTSISFIFGLDETMNISNAYVSEDFHNTMAWPDAMGGGYHYMRLEGAYNHSDGTEHFYNTHLGRWQQFDNYIEYIVPISMNASQHEAYEISIDMNVNNWYATPHLYNFEDFEAGIMGNLTAQDLLSANGVDVFGVAVLKK